ncbi:MAG: BolA family transcriptional regulator [Betaproteobacteria bacterium]|nr:MAG: BolA family transcriptional regulator [Betaproteobacteria bacterium]
MTGGASDLASTLRTRLSDLAPSALEIHDDSAEHVGHAGAAGGGGHFSLLIVSNAFRGISRLERHQKVLARVSDLLPHPIHALSIKALAPEEFS